MALFKASQTLDEGIASMPAAQRVDAYSAASRARGLSGVKVNASDATVESILAICV